MSSTWFFGDQRRWWLIAAVLLLVAAGGLTAGVRGGRAALPGPTAPPPKAAAGPSTAEVVARSVPVLLSIPAIGLSVDLSTVGLNADGTVQVPTNFNEPGWFGLGPTPGQVGSAVILGHVDSFQGPAVFFELRSLQVGDQVDVLLTDGVTAVFTVTGAASYLKTQFPATQVYGFDGGSDLQLVTCGGTFDADTGHYLSNVVVYTSLVGTIPAVGPGNVIPLP